MNVHSMIILFALFVSLAGIAYGQNEMNNATTGITPSVAVMDQAAVGNNITANITVAEVISDGPGWIAIHNDLFGHPGGVIGYTHVNTGRNSNVPVIIHTFVATDGLLAVLHYDRGMPGTFEYPAVDIEQRASGQIVIKPFSIKATPNIMLMNLTQMARNMGVCGK
ncbi:MAG: hypothetical protein ACE14P_04905 [Methanotrichaceae archaeon]